MTRTKNEMIPSCADWSKVPEMAREAVVPLPSVFLFFCVLHVNFRPVLLRSRASGYNPRLEPSGSE